MLLLHAKLTAGKKDHIRQNTNIDFIKCCSIPQWRSFITKHFPHNCKLRDWNGTLITKDVRNTWPGNNIQDLYVVNFFRTLQRKPTAFPLNKARQWQLAICTTTLWDSIPGSGGPGGRAGKGTGKARPPALQRKRRNESRGQPSVHSGTLQMKGDIHEEQAEEFWFTFPAFISILCFKSLEI